MKLNIAIVAGGDSSEHEVSLRSAQGIAGFLDKQRYSATIVALRGTDWHACVGNQNFPINKNDFSYQNAQGETVRFDFAYITIHGTPGENGLLQGYFDMLHVPYSCCGALSAGMTFNKYVCNRYLQYFGVNVADAILVRRGQTVYAEDVVSRLGLPCFVKSNVGGSSFGVTKVKTLEQIQPAIQRAFEEGDEVVIESYLKGTEITCGVYKTLNKAVAFPITEVVTHNEFFDYDAKYKGEVEEITPARIPDSLRDRVQELTLRIYDIMNCRGIIRIDYIITDGGKINLLEINTTPGMTATSFIPQQVRAAGLSITDVLTEIIEDSLVRNQR